MGFEVWIAIVLVASGLSGWIGYAYARKDAPKQAEIEAMAAELEQARQQAESVQDNVSEHFEQSAMLFGKLAADYREFLDHFESSAQNLGLSEARARELIEQGFQPLLTHEASDAAVVEAVGEEALSGSTASDVAADEAGRDEAMAGIGEVTVELPDEVGMAGADSQASDTDESDSASESADRQRA